MDTDGQLTFEDDAASIGYKQGFQHLVRMEFQEALKVFRDLAAKESIADLPETIKAVEHWIKQYSAYPGDGPEERKVSFLKNAWSAFEVFCEGSGHGAIEVRDHLKKPVFMQIRDLLKEQFNRSLIPNIEVLADLALCLLELKETDKAMETLNYANRLQPFNIRVLSVMSDAAWQAGEAARSKILLREVFLLDPDKVPVDELTSRPARDMVVATDSEGHERDRLRWMPVVGTYRNILDVKKHLTAGEYADIEMQCRNLEDEMAGDRRRREGLKPLLIYRYFYLIDSLLVSGHLNDPRLKTYENRLRSLDGKVHREYVDRVIYHGA